MKFNRRTFIGTGLALAGVPFMSGSGRAQSASLAGGRLDDPPADFEATRSSRREMAMSSEPELWNARYEDVRPAGIVVALDEGDVAQAIVFAREEGFDLALRSGGDGPQDSRPRGESSSTSAD